MRGNSFAAGDIGGCGIVIISEMTAVIPKWLDTVPGVDFTPEKKLLEDLERWASSDGWTVSDGRSLPESLRQRTDVLLVHQKRDRQLRIAVLPKAKRSPGAVRIDASSLRVFELVYRPKEGQWRVETAAVPLCGRRSPTTAF